MRRNLELSETGAKQLSDQARAWSKSHLPPSGKRGRPAIVSAYVEWLLQQHRRSAGAVPEPARATFGARRGGGARKIDQDATVAFARAWRAAPKRLHTFQDVDPIVRTVVPSADRPQRVARITQGFCQRHVLTPFDLHPLSRVVDCSTALEEQLGFSPVLDPRVDMVAEYHYVLAAYVQTELGDFRDPLPGK